jgi:hypothetical protein
MSCFHVSADSSRGESCRYILFDEAEWAAESLFALLDKTSNFFLANIK